MYLILNFFFYFLKKVLTVLMFLTVIFFNSLPVTVKFIFPSIKKTPFTFSSLLKLNFCWDFFFFHWLTYPWSDRKRNESLILHGCLWVRESGSGSGEFLDEGFSFTPQGHVQTGCRGILMVRLLVLSGLKVWTMDLVFKVFSVEKC